MAALADIIRGIPIFSSLSREDIAKVLGKMEEISFGAAQTIFVQGDKGDAFYLIKDGTVQVLLESPSGRSEPIAVLGPQNWFGEMALLSGEPRSATIVTVKETTLWKLSREAWDELIEKHPSWLLQFCATLSKRLSRADQQYKSGRDAFNSLAEEFYSTRSPAQQAFYRRASLLSAIDVRTADQLQDGRREVSPAGDAADEEVDDDPPFPQRGLQFTGHGSSLLPRCAVIADAAAAESDQGREAQQERRADAPH